MEDDSYNYKQVRKASGGGTRAKYLTVASTMENVLDVTKEFFFPDGKSHKKGDIEDYHCLV